MITLIETLDLHAQANPADPFARMRAHHYIEKGYILQSEVYDDAIRQLALRGVHIKREPASRDTGSKSREEPGRLPRRKAKHKS